MPSQNRIAQAIEENQLRMWKLLAEYAADARFETMHGATAVSLPYPIPLFNTVLKADIAPGREDEAIDAVSDFYRERQLPWHWSIGPATSPANLHEHLLKRGFQHGHDAPGMAIDLRHYKSPVIENVVEAKDDGSYRVWLQMADRGFGLPAETIEPFQAVQEKMGWDGIPLRYFYVTSKGEPVAFSMNYYGAGVAGIYCVATVPEARRKGFGAVAMHACLTAAVEDGYDVAILQSSRMGVPLYESLGFKEYCKLASYKPPA
jgi:GNAT superfamily N-acetyltransferase